MLTKTDYAELEKRFVTKEEFNTTIQNLSREIVEIINDLREEILEQFKEFRAEMSEFRVEVRLELANHEKRIGKLEEKKYS